METEIQKNFPARAGSRLQCPICRGVTHISSHQRKIRYRTIFRQSFERLFHQRVCASCYCCFSTLKAADSLRLLFMPLLSWIFPYLSEFRSEGEDSQSTINPHMPNPPEERCLSKIERNTSISCPIPFSIDRKNREITFQIQCPLEKGNFAEQVNAAAISLQTHLRLAADQINALVLSNSIAKTEISESSHSIDVTSEAQPEATPTQI